MNRICLIGRITKELELRYTPSNKAVCDFTLAVNRDKENADFINCVVWEKQAENLKKYQGKGSLIGLDGQLRCETFEKKDGTTGYKTYVFVNNIEYLESKKEDKKEELSTNQTSKEITQNEEYDPFSEFGESVEITDNFLD